MEINKDSIDQDVNFDTQMQYIDKIKDILYKRYKDESYFAFVHSYGCQQNVSDGEKIKGVLALMGYSFCDNPNDAQIVIYNTCAIRENAELKVFGNVGALKHHKKLREDMIIALCGCMMQQEHIVKKVKNSYPFVDLVFGTHVLQKLPKLIFETLTSPKRVFDISKLEDKIIEGMPIKRDKEYKAWVPIMYGCNKFCTYCIVPYVRGRERSRKMSDIIIEVKSLVAQGYKEITLLGQNVNSYGIGLEEDVKFSDLLRELNKIEGDFRIRFMSSHPKDATFELIDAIAECDKVCNHFHLPVQSGSDRILKLMNRGYKAKDYIELVNYARKKIPDIAFTSDIIVGFPGETKEDFQDTIKLIKEVEFDSIFSFIYSKREGTKAADMEDLVSQDEKSEWFQLLLQTQREIGKIKYKNCVGNIDRILVDGEGKAGEEYITGRNEGYMIVDFIGDKSLIGKFVNVKITKSLNWALEAEIITK